MKVDGDWSETFEVSWDPLSSTASATWGDRFEAAEHGTYGVATLLAEELADLTVVERSAKGTGFDYWLGPKSEDGDLFQKTVRLEVSGILADGTRISSRVSKKKKQTDQSAGPIPALVIVVEFGTPKARMAKR